MLNHELAHPTARAAIRDLHPAGYRFRRALDRTQETKVGGKSNPSVRLDRGEFQVGDAVVSFVSRIDAVMDPARDFLVVGVLDGLAFEDLDLRHFAADGVDRKEKCGGGGEKEERMSKEHPGMIAASGRGSQRCGFDRESRGFIGKVERLSRPVSDLPGRR